MPTSTTSSSANRNAIPMRWLRRTMLVLLLVGGACTLWPEPPAVCQQQLVGGVVATVCGPLTVSDPRAVMFLLLVLLLLLPDLRFHLRQLHSLRHQRHALAAQVVKLQTELAEVRSQAATLRRSLVGGRPE